MAFREIHAIGASGEMSWRLGKKPVLELGPKSYPAARRPAIDEAGMSNTLNRSTEYADSGARNTQGIAALGLGILA